MSKLPDNWIETTLGEIALWGSGGTPNRNISEYYGGKIPWFKTGELNEGVITDAEEHLTEEGLKNSSAKIFPKGSIIIAMYGATIGKCAILGIDGSTNQACAVAQPRRGIEPLYIFHYLRSQKQNFIEKGKGGAQPNISQTVIKEHPIPLPPLPEQKRIVEKLDTLFGHLDQLKVRLQNISILINQFRQTVLTQAVSGKLTEEWRGTKSKSKWVEDFVGNFVKEIKDKIDPREADETPYIGLEHIESNGGLIGRGSSFDVKSTKTAFKKNDILYGKLRPYLNKHVVVEFDGVCSTDILVYRTANIAAAKYFNYWLNLDSIVHKINAETKGINLPRVSASTINSLIIPIPPNNEQKEIVRRVESLFAVADRIQENYQTLKEKIDELPQAILSKAFKGGLVKQNPDDGNASELLKSLTVETKASRTTKSQEKTVTAQKHESNVDTKSTKKEVSVEDFELTTILVKKFGDRSFTFTQATKNNKMSYDEFKAQLFEILDVSEKSEKGIKMVLKHSESDVSFQFVKN